MGRDVCFVGREDGVEKYVAVKRRRGGDDHFATLDGKGAGSGGDGAVAVDDLGNGGDWVGEKDGSRWESCCEALGERLRACGCIVSLGDKGSFQCSVEMRDPN